MERPYIQNISVIGAWAWIIMIQNAPNGLDIIDAIVMHLVK